MRLSFIPPSHSELRQPEHFQCDTLGPCLSAGTPGVGKSTTCEQLSEATGLRWLNVSEIAREADCLDEFDPQYGCRILNEDKVR